MSKSSNPRTMSADWRVDDLDSYVPAAPGTASIERVEWLAYDVDKANLGGDVVKGGPRRGVSVRIRARGGAEGLSMLPWWGQVQSGKPEVQQKAEGLLIGEDAFARERLWRALRQADLPLDTIALVDTALWDLFGKAMGQPVHGLFGTKRTRVKPYRSTPFNLGTPDEYAADAIAARQRGYAGYKVHPCRRWDQKNDPQKDIPVYRAVREAVGPDWPIMSDNFLSYTFDESVQVGELLQALGYRWCESPMAEDETTIDDYVQLCRALEIPVMAPETGGGDHLRRYDWIERGATDMGRIDCLYGGFTPCMKLALACEKLGIKMDLHTAQAAHLPVIAATDEKTMPFIEDYARSFPYQMDAEGWVALPTEPGIGHEPDWAQLEPARVEP